MGDCSKASTGAKAYCAPALVNTENILDNLQYRRNLLAEILESMGID